jgi:DNA mismatch repair ATPase MutS
VWLVFLFVNIVLWQVLGQRAYATLSPIGSHELALRQYAAGFDLLSTVTFDAPRLVALQGALHANGHSAATHIHTLERIARCVIPRGAMVYWVIQMICLWDLHVQAALEEWQATVGPNLREWLAALGEIEALAALAALAHAHPGWAIPEIESTACQVAAEQAGHPLLAPGIRVDNDITLGPPGTFVLVTGSNMAGKSTYLRTIGVNIVLAQAGGPVCARAFRMPSLELCTSMRVVDSLERGVSTFFAEVVRLKQVVDVVRQAADEHIVCYLLDEILQGTNSAERQIAVRRVVRFLLTRRAIGAISTHDLALADLPELGEHAHLVHFQETLTDAPQGPIMSFGYRLQPGLATSTNALQLVAMLGLDESY